MSGAEPLGPSGQSGQLVSLQPRTVWRWMDETPQLRTRRVVGTVLSADISGFTRLGERLAELGVRQAAEELNATINRCFEPMIDDVVDRGGDVLKFGGDAIFALFEGEQAARQGVMAAAAMQRHLREVDLGGHDVLSMTVGIASGEIGLALAGVERRELIVHGTVVDECLQLESDAEPGEVLIAPATAELVPPAWWDELEPGVIGLDANLVGDEAPPPGVDDPGPAVEAARGAEVLGGRLADAIDAYVGTAGEIRLVTVAFVFVPTQDDDAETLLGVVERAMELTDRFGTTLLGTDVAGGGIKLLLTAGAPLAGDGDEDAMISTVSELVLDPEAPSMRAGVNRGLVYAGFLGSAVCRTFTIMGDPTNLAARLLGKADDRSVAVSQAVLDQCRASYATTELAPVLVKGRTEPVTVHRLGQAVAGSRQGRVTPTFVGRQDEIGELTRLVEQARLGSGSVIEFVGEGGIGTTRLVDEFVANLPRGVLHFDVSGEVATQATPFRAVLPFFRSLAGIDHQVDRVAAGQRLEAWVGQLDPDLVDWLPLIAPIFDADVTPTAASSSVSLEFRPDRLKRTIVSLVERALTVPTVLVMTDQHWVDQASRDLVRALVEACEDHPWVIVATGRPGAQPIGGDETIRRIGPLPTGDVEAIIAEIGDLPDALIPEIARRSGGNPLFAVELVDASHRPGDGAGSAGATIVADSIEGLVTARIDRLGHEARVLLRTASVLGERFDLDLLEELDEQPMAENLGSLGDLLTADDSGRASFRSAVIHAVAYEGLSMRRRRELHAVVAEVMERRDADIADLARHHGLANNHLACWDYSRRSAERAIRLGAVDDGFEHLQRAIAAAFSANDAAHLLDGQAPVEASAIADLLVESFDVGVAARRYEDALAAGEQALTMLDDPLARTRMLVKVCTTSAETQGSYAAQTDRLNEAIAACGDGDDAAARRAWLQGSLAGMLYRADRQGDALDAAEAAITAAEASGEVAALPPAMLVKQLILVDRVATDRFEVGQTLIERAADVGDQRVLSIANNNMAIAYKAAGDWQKSLDHYEVAAKEAESIGDGYRAMFPAVNRGTLLLDQGRWREARELLDEGRRVAEYYDSGLMGAWTRAELGRLEVNRGRPSVGRPLLTDALDWLVAADVQSFAHQTRLSLLAADLADGRSAEVLAAAADLDEPEEVPGEVLGWLSTILGYAMMQQARPEDALEHLERAVAETDGRNVFGHALALVGRSEAEQFLGRGRSAKRSRAAADEILASLGVVDLPAIPLPR